MLLLAAAVGGLYLLVTRSAPGVLFSFHEAAVASGCAVCLFIWIGQGMNPPYHMNGMLFLVLGLAVPFSELVFSLTRPDLFWIVPAALGFLYFHGAGATEAWEKAHRNSWNRLLAEADALLQKDPGDAEAHLRKAKLYENARMWAQARGSFQRAFAAGAKKYTKKRLEADQDRVAALEQKENAEKDAALKRREDGTEFPLYGEVTAFVLFSPLLLWDFRRFIAVSAVWAFALWCTKAEISGS